MSDYYKTKESVQEYIQMAKDVNGGNLIKELNKFLPAGAELLEIGSGPGTDWKILNTSYAVTGSDFSEEFLNHLRTNIPEGTFLMLDAETLHTTQLFDGIYSNKVMHHLTDDAIKNSIKRQYELLKSGGIICHSFWKGEGTEIFKGMFVNYHNKEGIVKFFGELFNILLIKEYKEFDEGDSIFLIASKK